MQNQSNRGANRRQNLRLVPVVPTGDVVAEFKNYGEAVNLVDRIIAGGFASNLVAIVGSDIKSVERIRGRLTYGRVSLAGALNGAFLGTLLGVIFASATSAAAMANEITAAAILGAGLGMIWNVMRMSLRGQNRQFLSSTVMIAATYQVVVPAGLGSRAQELANKQQV